MQKSEAYYHRELRCIALTCVLCSLIGCTPKQEASPRPDLNADFNVAVTHDGRTVVWWLRMSGPDFTGVVHKSAANPQLGGADDFTHQVVNTLIAVGLEQHGLIRCPPVYRTVAVMKNGAVQFTGTCIIPESVNVSSNGS